MFESVADIIDTKYPKKGDKDKKDEKNKNRSVRRTGRNKSTPTPR